MQKKKVAAILVATTLLLNIARPTINATEPTVKITNLKYKYTINKAANVVSKDMHTNTTYRQPDENVEIEIRSEDEIPQSVLNAMLSEHWIRYNRSFYFNQYQQLDVGYSRDPILGGTFRYITDELYGERYPGNNSNWTELFRNSLATHRFTHDSKYNQHSSLDIYDRVLRLYTQAKGNKMYMVLDSMPFNFELEVPASMQNQVSYEYFTKTLVERTYTQGLIPCLKVRHPKDYIATPVDKEAITVESVTDTITNVCTRGVYTDIMSAYTGTPSIDKIQMPNSFNGPIQFKLIPLEEYKKQTDVQTRVLQKQIEDLQRQTQEALTAKAALAAENAKIEQRKQTLEQEYQRLKGEVTSQRQTLQQERDSVTAEKAKLEQQKTEFANKQQQWQATYDAQKAEAQQKSQQAQQKELDATAKVAEAEEKLRTAKLTDSANTQKLLELGSQLEKAKQDQEKARAEYLSYNEKLSKLNKEYEKIRADREATERALNEANSKLADVTSRQQALATKEQTIAQKEKEVANLQEEKRQNDLRAKQLEEQLKNNNLSIEYISKLKAQIEKQKQALPWEEIGLVENTDSYNKDTFRTNKLPVKPIVKKKATTEIEKGNVVMVDLSNGLTIKKVEGLEEVQSFYDATTSDKIKLYKITEDTQLIEFTHIVKASKIGKSTQRIPAIKLNPAKKSVPMTALTPATPLEKQKVTQPLTKLELAKPIVPVEVKPQVQPKTPEVNAPSGGGGGGGGGSSSSSTPATTRERDYDNNSGIQLNKIATIPAIPATTATVEKEKQSVQPIAKDVSIAEAISYVNKNNIMVGDTKGNFNPEATLTRAQVAQILTNKNKLEPTKEKIEFKDVNQGAWFYKAVKRTVNNELFAGTSANTFEPNKDITLGEFAKVLDNQYNIVKATSNIQPQLQSQVKNKATWNSKEVVALEKLGILQPLKLTDAKKPVTRGQVAVMITKLDRQYRK